MREAPEYEPARGPRWRAHRIRLLPYQGVGAFPGPLRFRTRRGRRWWSRRWRMLTGVGTRCRQAGVQRPEVAAAIVIRNGAAGHDPAGIGPAPMMAAGSLAWGDAG